MTEGLEHEESLGPDDPGSMAYKLAHATVAPQKEEVEPDEATQQAETEAAAQAETDATVAEQAADSAAAEAAEKSEPPAEAPKPKYASIEEAEKAANEAASRMHTATEEAATERKARETLAAEMDLTKKELADLKAVQETAAAEVAKLVPKADRKAAYAAALKTIKAIPLTRDPETGEVVYPDDYDDQVAEAWSGTAVEVDPKEIAKEAAKLAREELHREQAAEKAKTAEEKVAADKERTWNDATKRASEYGLDMTPGSADARLFQTFVDELGRDPNHEYRDKPFEEQVKWASTGVRQVLGKKIELTDAERKAALTNQNKNAVLERGINRTTPPEPKKQRSMQEILEPGAARF